MDGRDRRESADHDAGVDPSATDEDTEPTTVDDVTKPNARDDAISSAADDDVHEPPATEPTDEEPTASQTDNVRSVDDRLSTPSDGSSSAARNDRRNQSPWQQFWGAETGPLVFIREILISVGIVIIIGLLLFGLSGVWPPMVAVESGSMEPNINQYDLVFVTDPGRFAAGEADDHGIVTAETAETTGYSSFSDPGNVIVFNEPGSRGSPIIHRAHLFVEEGEDWHDRADPDYTDASDCDELSNCPAPNSGYITKGDNQNSNSRYDQASGIAPVVEPDWVTGVGRLRIPYLGWIRLAVTGAASSGPLLPVGIGAVGGVVGGSLVAFSRS